MNIKTPTIKKPVWIKAAGSRLILMFLLLSLPSGFAVAAPLAANANDGDGQLTVNPVSVIYGSSTTFDFTFTADTGDFQNGTQLVIHIPSGWTPPSNSGSGRVTILSHNCTLRSPGAEIAGFTSTTVSVDFGCAQNETFTVRYASAKPSNVIGSPYTFTSTTEVPGGTAPAEIALSPSVSVDPKELTVSATGLTPANKTYDGTTDATLTIGTPTLVGVVGTDSVNLVTNGAVGTFSDKHIGTGKLVTISGLTLGGADADNYALIQPTRSANITKRPITITAATDSKTYDGTTTSGGVPVLSVGTPLSPGDTEPAWTQTFDNKNAGTGKTLTPAGAVIDGNSGLNYAYTFVPNTTGEIVKLPITITAVTDSKTFDGTTASSGLPVLSAGTPLAPGDTEPVWTQTFDTIDAGINKALTPAGAVIDGNNGLNYAYTFVSDNTGTILARPITVTADAKAKMVGAPDPILTYTITNGSLVSPDTVTGALIRVPGEVIGQYDILQGTLALSSNYTLTYIGAKLTINPRQVLIFYSAGAQDGWILELTETSTTGGTMNNTATTLNLGDDAADKQYRAILHFDTSLLPDTAVITSAILQLRKQSISGTNPFTILGSLRVDARRPSFGTSVLQLTDFRASAAKNNIATFNPAPVGPWYSATFNSTGRVYINRTGTTQFKIYFTTGDNDDLGADIIRFYSGNKSAAYRPKLVIEYYVP